MITNDNEQNSELLLIKQKCEIYFDNHQSVHVVLKSGEWLNGKIEELNGDLFTIIEFKKGEMPVFFIEIQKIEPYIDIKKEGEQ